MWNSCVLPSLLKFKVVLCSFYKKKNPALLNQSQEKLHVQKRSLPTLAWTLFISVLRRPLLMSSSAFLRTWVLFNRSRFQFPLTLWSIQFSLPSSLPGPSPRLHLHRGAQPLPQDSPFPQCWQTDCYRKITKVASNLYVIIQPMLQTWCFTLGFSPNLLSASISSLLFSSRLFLGRLLLPVLRGQLYVLSGTHFLVPYIGSMTSTNSQPLEFQIQSIVSQLCPLSPPPPSWFSCRESNHESKQWGV